MLVDKTPNEIAVLDQLIIERASNGPSVTNSTLQAALLQTNASYKSPADYQAITVAANTLYVERRGKWNYATIRGLSSSVTITAITNSGISPFVEGDSIEVRSKLGFVADMQITGQPSGLILSDPSKFVTYVMDSNGGWALTASNPSLANIKADGYTRYSITTPTLAMYGGAASVRYLGAETPATGDVTINTSGVAGSVSSYVDEAGYGAMLLGTFSYTGSPTTTTVAAGLAAAIHANYLALVHFYDASNTGPQVDIVPPQGRGAFANAYVLSSVDTGDCASTPTGFSGGVDGAETNGTIEVISMPLTDGVEITILNEMAANTLTFDGPAVAGSNLATTNTLQPYECCKFKGSEFLGKYSKIV